MILSLRESVCQSPISASARASRRERAAPRPNRPSQRSCFSCDCVCYKPSRPRWACRRERATPRPNGPSGGRFCMPMLQVHVGLGQGVSPGPARAEAESIVSQIIFLAGPSACKRADSAWALACSPGQSTSVNIQSTYSQHTVNTQST